MKSLYDESEFLVSEGKRLKLDIWKTLCPVMEKWHKEKGFKAREIGELINVIAHLLVARQIADNKMLAGKAIDKTIGELHNERLRHE
jgi:hypothetical protein